MSFTRIFLGALAIALFAFLATYRLSENPPTWLDEGTIAQVSINLSQSGMYGIQTAPGHFISTDFLTTGFPVIYPIAASFSLFGTTILNARIIMLLFMTLLCALSYILVYSLATERRHAVALFSLFLLITFAPLYGHGKNVLGEVPGLMYFVASLILFHFATRRSAPLLWVLSGVLTGLSMVTKPIYLLIIAPSAFLIFLIERKKISLSAISLYVTGVAGILLLWFFVHIGSIEALKQILFTGNADNTTLSARLLKTVWQFLSELQPLYFLGLLGVWWTSILLRAWNKVEVSTVELYAGIFSAINFGLYLASRGFYRYFFPAEALALVFLPLALYQTPIPNRYRNAFIRSGTALLVTLILFQGYQTFFRSWIAEFKDSTRAALLSEHLQNIPAGKSIFLYNVPEAVIFLSSNTYYQYLRYGDTIIRGEEHLPLLFGGFVDLILVDQKFPDTDKILPLYTEVSRFDKYVLYEKKATH
ncbi:hypothetical protein EXS56_00880 [Candidatus Kaiserbacteria bacterium]|nr:hypothetical protein [Candidatus Kaiserbacteria bacterium]